MPIHYKFPLSCTPTGRPTFLIRQNADFQNRNVTLNEMTQKWKIYRIVCMHHRFTFKFSFRAALKSRHFQPKQKRHKSGNL